MSPRKREISVMLKSSEPPKMRRAMPSWTGAPISSIQICVLPLSLEETALVAEVIPWLTDNFRISSSATFHSQSVFLDLARADANGFPPLFRTEKRTHNASWPICERPKQLPPMLCQFGRELCL